MEVMKMKEFYSFTKEDLPDLVSFFKKEDEMVKQEIPVGRGKRLSFLLRLVIDLIADGERNRKLKTMLETIKQMNKKKIIEAFIKILEEWLEENGGNGNFLEVILVFRSNGYSNFASLVERFLLRYSLPISEDGKGHEVNVYSLSRDFLKETFMGFVPLWNANPVEQALQNSVILEEVFRKLNSRDQKMFRLVTPTWMKETFSYWRRSSILQLRVPENPDDAKENRISMSSFVKLLDLEGSARKRKNVESKHQLLEHPFHCYQLSYQSTQYYPWEVPFSCGKTEAKFWQLCGPNIEDLEIDEALFGTAPENTADKICEKIFRTCPKLKKFKILGLCRTDHNSEFLLVNNESLQRKTEKNNENIGSELHTLAVEGYITEANLRKILFHCPNLKVLNIKNFFGKTGNALTHPTSNGEFLKLKKLIVKYSPDPTYADEFLTLRNYSEMLMKNGFNCLQHLVLEEFSLSDARQPPFSLYAALARSSQNLKTLQLMISIEHTDDTTGDRKWFADLSPFAFPNLTALKLCFDLQSETENIHFDFGTLKGMPKLERFEFRVENEESLVRNPGTHVWIFQGDRNEYLPEGVTVDYCYSQEEPLLCNNLKEFTFIGWSLNEEDIKLFSTWFPNLTRLKAAVKLELYSILESLTRLEKLELETTSLVSLGDLRSLKEKKKGLRICQNISGKYPQSVEIKEHNGRLYFASQNSE